MDGWSAKEVAEAVVLLWKNVGKWVVYCGLAVVFWIMTLKYWPCRSKKDPS